MPYAFSDERDPEAFRITLNFDPRRLIQDPQFTSPRRKKLVV
jgi:hypothetical protein